MASYVMLLSLSTFLLSIGCGSFLVKAAITGANSRHATDNTLPNGSHDDCSHSDVCVPEVECLHERSKLTPCSTANNAPGVCCSTNDSNDKLLKSAIRDGRQEFQEKLGHVEKHRPEMTANEKPQSMFHRLLNSAAGHHAKDGSKRDPKNRPDAYESVFATRKYVEMTNMTKEERQSGRFVRHARTMWPSYAAFSPVGCDPNARYRTFDGTCNNPTAERASWGSAEYPFERILSPVYEDGVWAPRAYSVTGHLLPGARTISAALFPDADRQDPFLNILFMQMGQFITHDITLSQSVTLDNGKDIECCTPDGSKALFGDQLHFACLPTHVSPYDPFFADFGVGCLNFVRIQLACGPECYLGYAQQANSVTSFVDASVVYGSSEAVANSLRTFQQGKLRSSHSTGIELLPFSRKPEDCVPWARVCYETGDFRANQLLALTQVQTLFLREHNRLAVGLSHVNPHWDDERLFQEARRILIAELQNIVFNEYLPILLGNEKLRQFGLIDPIEGYAYAYNPDLPPMTLVEGAVAAFRFGHSTVEGFFRILRHNSPSEIVPIKDIYFNPSKIQEPNSFDTMMYSFGQQSQQLTDHYMSSGLTNHLFQREKPFGLDLASLTITRGRDFGMRPYNDYRVWAGLPRVTDFHQLGEAGLRLAQVYESPDDIDLWVGGLHEEPSYGAVVGPTFNHLLAEMFRRIKHGDRYYFANGPEVNPGAFSLRQLREVQLMNLTGLICANVDNRYDFYQAPSGFMKSGYGNEPIPCANYRSLDLEAWRE